MAPGLMSSLLAGTTATTGTFSLGSSALGLLCSEADFAKHRAERKARTRGDFSLLRDQPAYGRREFSSLPIGRIAERI